MLILYELGAKNSCFKLGSNLTQFVSCILSLYKMSALSLKLMHYHWVKLVELIHARHMLIPLIHALEHINIFYLIVCTLEL